MKLSNWKQLKTRSDLVVSTQSQQGKVAYVVKDPITLRYFRLKPTEYAIMRMLDGATPIDEVKRRLEQLGHEIEDGELQSFLQQLGAANFFENVLPNQSESLYQLALLRRRHKSLWAQVKRILFIKIPLWDPDRLFNRVLPHVRFLWSKWVVRAYALLFVTALYLFLTNFQEARASFREILAFQNIIENLLILYVLMIIVTSVHELAHGLTCKYFGGEVHELGLLVLVLTPCLYCNITDAWIQDRHSRKFFISAAGIISGLIIASIATLVWWAAAPGAARALAYRTMVLAGVTSVFVNGNPLMKFDAYYILSDVLGMPNLRSNSVLYAKQFFKRYVLGLDVPGASILSRENAIKLVYGTASTLWIFYIMYRIVQGLLHRLPPLGIWILITTMYGLFFIPAVRIAVWMSKRRGKKSEVSLSRIGTLSLAAALAGYFLFFYDMGYAVSASCVIMPGRRHYVFAAVPGVLRETPFREGQDVRAGEVIARMENRALELRLNELSIVLKALRLQANQADSLGDFAGRDYLRDSLREMAETAKEVEQEIEALTIHAPFNGMIVREIDRSQVGRYLKKGTPIFEFVGLERARVTVAVSENILPYVKEDAYAYVTLRAYPWHRFEGKVDSVSLAPVRILPSAALSARAGGGVATRPEISSAEIAIGNTYEVTILLPNDDPDRPLSPGMAGKAKISYSGGRRPWNILYMKVRANLRRSFGV